MAKRPWTVTLKAKGIEQTFRKPWLTPLFSTIHELPSGSFVENYYNLCSVDDARMTAVAIFTRSVNRKVAHGKAR